MKKVVAKIDTPDLKSCEFYDLIKEDYINGIGVVYYVIDGSGYLRRYVKKYFYDISEWREKKINELLDIKIIK